MAILSFSLKALLLSTGVLSTALLLKLSFPTLLEFFTSGLPEVWNSLLSWLTPPYLYFVINGIIISIAASSKFQHKVEEEAPEVAAPLKNAAEVRHEFEVPPVAYEMPPVAYEVPPVACEAVVVKCPSEILPDYRVPEPVMEYADPEEKVSDAKVTEDDDFVISRSDWEPKQRDSTEYSHVTEKPLVSVRFGHRKSVKACPEGSRALGVAKPKRNETFESTWKTITEGRPMPLTRHLRKSDTFETNSRVRSDHQDPKPQVKKSETMKKDRRTTASPSPSPGSGKPLRKEPSPSQDELNRRVEAFINKFNEEMRLQRQESLNHYMEMVNRGSQ